MRHQTKLTWELYKKTGPVTEYQIRASVAYPILDGTNNVLTLYAVLKNDLPLEQTESINNQIRAEMAGMKVQHVTVELESPDRENSKDNCAY